MKREEIWERFVESVPFDLYPFQEEAVLAWFESTGGVLVCAPTGMGKTLIAEAAIFEALHTRTRLYYTTPLIALTDQKYREIQAKAVGWGFAPEDVGLLTGNRKENPDALVRVVVAEILLNHLLTNDPLIAGLSGGGAIVMDEFHSFNDAERGIVWELALVMLPPAVRVMLLSATVGNPWDFADWLKREHDRKLTVVLTDERRVPLEFHWVENALLTEHLPQMVESDRVPALVFCFNRDECWEVAERLKGLPLTTEGQRKEIEKLLSQHDDDLREGVGPKLRQMLHRGVGVHHAGVLPRHKQVVETLFLSKLVPFVVCTETLAAGINLPARSVVLSTLLKGPPRERKLIPASSAHQMFGRAGRPQFDTQGHVYAVAHDDDVKIRKWKERYDKIDPNSKDPGLMRMRKEMEKKRPTRRKTEQYWGEGQFKTLIEAGAAKLQSRAMIPYSVLIFQLTRQGNLPEVRRFLGKRFNTADQLEKFQLQLDFMLSNLASLGYISGEGLLPAEDAAGTAESSDGADERRVEPVQPQSETLPEGASRDAPHELSATAKAIMAKRAAAAAAAGGANAEKPEPPRFRATHVTLNESIWKLLHFRSVDPLYGAFLCETLLRANDDEKMLALESVLETPPQIARRGRLPWDLPKGPLQEYELEPLMIAMGVALEGQGQGGDEEGEEEEGPRLDERRHDWLARDPTVQRPPNFPEMLKLAFEARLAAPEPVFVQPKWLAGAAFSEFDCEFFQFVKARDLIKQEGLILRHFLRLAILAGEFRTYTDDPTYEEIAERAVKTCQRVDAAYTAHFLEEARGR